MKATRPSKPKVAEAAKPARRGSPKGLTVENLVGLGAERLATVLLEIAQGQPSVKQRIRLELVGQSSGAELAAEIRKRLGAIQKSRSFVDWKKQADLARELTTLRSMITDRVAASHPAEAFDLLCVFLDLAGPVLDRVDDSGGRVSDLFFDAVADFGALAVKARPDATVLIDRVLAILHGNGVGLAGPLVAGIYPALDAMGVAVLQSRLQAALKKQTFGRVVTSIQLSLRVALLELADCEGDVEAFVAALRPDDVRVPHFGAGIARRWLMAGQPDKALAALEQARPPRSGPLRISVSDLDDEDAPELDSWTAAYLDVLDATGQGALAQKTRWSIFEDRLSPTCLRAYLKALPDFEDDAAERKAMEHVRRFKNFGAALWFFVQWPALRNAADLVKARRSEIDGNAYALLDPAARALESKDPFAATLLCRAMIVDTLKGGKSSRYKHAARHLAECATLAAHITDDQGLENHAHFVAEIQKLHGRKAGFWAEVKAL